MKYITEYTKLEHSKAAETFAIFPCKLDSEVVLLQSDKHNLVVDLKTGTSHLSLNLSLDDLREYVRG